MRLCIVGGGLVGAALAWRMLGATTGWRVELAVGEAHADATAASGGAVRAYETDPEQRWLATASLAELLGSHTLRAWADFRPVESVYLRGGADGLDAAACELENALPGSVDLVTAGELARRGWADLPPQATAVVERLAGYTSPNRWRDALLGEVSRGGMPVLVGLHAITPQDDGTIVCRFTGEHRAYDAVVVAAGAWTPRLLRASGLPADTYRTKSIQYAVYPAAGGPPGQFVDELTGLYGRPTPDGELLLGLPTADWGVDPDHPTVTASLHAEAARLAGARFPRLRLGPAARVVGAVDCYADRPVLALRPVLTSHRLLTLSGGAGSAAKTALAASLRAAIQLLQL